MAKTDASGSRKPDWTPKALAAALRATRTGDRVAALKRIGILDGNGRLAKKYRSWGKKVTRTPSATNSR